MDNLSLKPRKILLHACCGPCSLEPVRLLREEGFEPCLYFANSNIQPAEEYERRLATLRRWANDADLNVVEGVYNPSAWKEAVEKAQTDGSTREKRCRACYRLRFEEAAAFAREHGYAFLGTTLSISPYQFIAIIEKELSRAARISGREAHFEDYRPYYDKATHLSRALGMYRQNYCGCPYSAAEAAVERERRRTERRLRKAARLAAGAENREREDLYRRERRAEREAYAAKRHHQRELLRSLRAKRKAQEEEAANGNGTTTKQMTPGQRTAQPLTTQTATRRNIQQTDMVDADAH